MGLSADDLAILLDSFEGSEWTELVLSIDGTQLALTKPGAEPARRPAQTQPEPPAAELPAEPASPPAQLVLSPSVGLFQGSAVAEGDSVDAGAVLGTLMVNKRLVEVTASAGGTVRSIHVADGDMVEYGQPLFTIES
jgi:acetyl-CoA carboxylase biotin carboxyl carrier protein